VQSIRVVGNISVEN